ncbi:lysine-rich nucleolar protein 1 isoform X2 [Oreochromis aureus]|uniref:lysine-rich nucleolar protein 1 isoform X2 n=1 Tax=Oreochromis aureus TaxID=47969 RepID=UPI001954DDCB|nr:lysine-rich nucleolar protein 1 isoform X2 [Oreochromis aureus]
MVKEEEEEEQVGKDNLPKKVKKGKKQVLDMNTEETEEKIKEKKKKNKVLADGEAHVETADALVKEQEVEKKQKKNVKNKSTQIKRENMVKEEEEEKQVEKDNVPKKANEKHALDMSTEVTEGQRKEKKKKQKCPLTVEEATIKKAKTAENGIKLEKIEHEDVKIKKKKKKETETKEENGVETEIKGKNKKSKEASDKVRKSEKQEKSTNSVIVTTDDEVMTEFKKKVKKGKCKIATVEATNAEKEEPKKKKRKKVQREEEEDKHEEVQKDEQSGEAGDTPKKKSKQKRSSAKVERVSDSRVEPVAKKKKNIKQEREDPEERRQALQMEIDKASQPDKKVKPAGLGQWSTAQFNSSEQQQKFLRLMGGFKKGFQPAARTTGGANMALGKDAQQQLQQGLLGEFERAHSRRMDFNNRGAGLGFTAPSNKKFSIDINTCRSVRFDD